MLRTSIVLACVVALRVGAQVETPIAFDSAGKIRSITPALVERFRLTAPVWPVPAPFVEARLYAVSAGGSVLVAERPDGTLARYPLSDVDRAALRDEVDAGMIAAGAVVSEREPLRESEPARSAFVRNQMILGAVLYGPLAASLTNDGRTATAVYLLTVAGSYFALSALPRTMMVTRAQNHLATDGALRGYGITSGLLATFGPDHMNYKTFNGAGLAGAIGMSVVGFHRGRGMTDSDAHAATVLSTLAAAAGLGVAGATGALDNDNRRVMGAVTTSAAVAGYLAGPLYPRRASYTVTAGDVQTLSVGATIGAFAGLAAFGDADNADRARLATATATGVLGVVLADRELVRPFDYGGGDVTELWLGTIAGGLVGTAFAVMTEPNATVTLSMITVGMFAGAAAGHHLADPPRAMPRTALLPSSGTRVAGARLHVDPVNATLAAARVRGAHPILTLSF